MIASFVRGLVAVALVAIAAPQPSFAGGDWNDKGIDWVSYEAGVAKAKEAKKPICLVFYTDWCPHCTNYAKIFHDEKIVEKAKSFVMVRVNKDQDAALSAKFKPDGEYIPRTYFLATDGVLDESLTENRPQYKYFYHELDPASLLGGMDRALAKLAK